MNDVPVFMKKVWGSGQLDLLKNLFKGPEWNLVVQILQISPLYCWYGGSLLIDSNLLDFVRDLSLTFCWLAYTCGSIIENFFIIL